MLVVARNARLLQQIRDFMTKLAVCVGRKECSEQEATRIRELQWRRTYMPSFRERHGTINRLSDDSYIEHLQPAEFIPIKAELT